MSKLLATTLLCLVSFSMQAMEIEKATSNVRKELIGLRDDYMRYTHPKNQEVDESKREQAGKFRHLLWRTLELAITYSDPILAPDIDNKLVPTLPVLREAIVFLKSFIRVNSEISLQKMHEKAHSFVTSQKLLPMSPYMQGLMDRDFPLA